MEDERDEIRTPVECVVGLTDEELNRQQYHDQLMEENVDEVFLTEDEPQLVCPQPQPHGETAETTEIAEYTASGSTISDPLDQRLRAIESHNRSIEAQLTALTSLVQTLVLQSERSASQRSASPGPHALLLDDADDFTHEIQSSNANGDTITPRKRSLLQPHQSAQDVGAMTRTVSTKGIPITDDVQDSLSPLPLQQLTPLTLSSAVRVVRQIAHAASRKTLRVPEMITPMMTRRFTVSSLNFDKRDVEETTQARRIARWSRILFQKGRIEPVVTKTEVIAARLEGMPVHPFTIRHDASSRIAWDACVMVLIMIDAVMTPLALSFGYHSQLLNGFNLLATVAFSMDFIIQALSSYTTKRGVMVSGPSKTIAHYCLSVWALADFLSCFPFEYMVSKGRFLGVAKVIRLVKISQLMRRFHSARKAGVFRLVRLISMVLLVSHCLTCYWNWVAKAWRLHEEEYLTKSVPEQYVHSWSIVIGSLNASPPAMYTPIEELSVAVFMLMGNVLQASVFGSVAVLIQSFDEEEVAYNKKLLNTYERCKMLDIPEPLANRINSYYEHLYRETRSVDPDADAFISELSPALICEVKFQLYRDMVKQIPFFSSANINPVLIETLILRLRTVIYMQDDMLIRKGEFGDWMGFIGSKGSVGVLDPRSETHKIVRILRKGEYFGEMALLHRTKRTTTAVALSWVQIHVLSRRDLDQVKEQYIEDAENLDQEIRKYMKSRVTSVAQLTSHS